jgi:hypothetical protein
VEMLVKPIARRARRGVMNCIVVVGSGGVVGGDDFVGGVSRFVLCLEEGREEFGLRDCEPPT